MADEDGGGEVVGSSFMNTFILMEELLDKLKLLGYEKEFCRGWGFKAFSRHYFAVPTNPGEQFFAFTNIVAWLLNQCSKSFDRPQEYDDPNATISEILDQSRSLGITVDFPPAKLKSGHGEQVIYLVNKLCCEALKSQMFSWKRPEYMEEEEAEENIVEDDAELTMDKLNDELAEEIEEEADEEEAYLDLSGMKQQNFANDFGTKPESMLESNVDANEWKLEIERVLPLLKVHIRADNKDWRNHYEQMQQYSTGISQTLQETQTQLDKLHQEISKTLEKVASREKYINNQLEGKIQDFRSKQDNLAVLKEKYNQSSGGVTELTQQLSQITDELEQVKIQMDERGTNMTDAGPLVRIKQALSKLKQECIEMDLEVGVLEHALLQGKVREKLGLEDKVNRIKSAKTSEL
ncbi:intraflagellar transport protein 57 homolog [Clytia hemisphaerica]|uniref:Intraflagellar transport protein 57 homolog n=1 Tax=Clytia hemisphaerica TaxID=252671 RepID=A0A7M5XAU8_9CNID|eukprot:TCONS_00023317-protein